MENKKIDNFLKAYGELTKKHGVDFANFPQFVPDGAGGFKIICQAIPIDLEEQAKAQRQNFMAKNV